MSFLIQQRADLKAVCKLGSNPLHRAAMGNNAVGVKLLVQAPISVRCRHAVVSVLWKSLRPKYRPHSFCKTRK